MMRKAWIPLLTLSVLVSPAAFAQSMNPAGQNAWDYYVFGNGPAIYKILESVKLLMLPLGGGGMFRSLLIVIALIGAFLVIVEAGFSPSKGVERLIGFFVMLAFVMFFTMGARVNVTINDNATGYYNTVTGVPAIVGVPASVISEIGYQLELGIEQDFSIPDGLKVSQSGMYDVMGQTLKDANSMVITDPDLKRDLAGYVENCVVPEIGLGRVSVDSLLNSPNLLQTFQAAATPSLLTPYYAPSPGSSSSTPLSDQGALEHCSDAYTSISTAVQTYANSLVSAQTSAWQAAGILVPFQTAMQDVLQEAASGGGGNPAVSGYSSPEGYILQSALINSTEPAFQQAAADLGENPAMLSTAIAQADQTQRSSWFTTVTVFHNMMGYVYLVLQGFVLAMVPIIAVMLLLPGLGAKIFMNYLQVLLWLVLWGPLFAVDNFIVALHGGSQLQNLLAPGLTMLNAGVMKESTVNLDLAASFLGTLIPLLAWGVVKGSFAFTEFIMHGMGSAFGQQAGSLAATGNVSLGNTSLDNVGMNKYSTSITSDVGDGGVGLSLGTGALSSNFQLGGQKIMAGGVDETPKDTYKLGYAVQVGNQMQRAADRDQADQMVAGYARAASGTEGYASSIAKGVSELHDLASQVGTHNSFAASELLKAANAYKTASQLTSKLQGAIKAGEADLIPVLKAEVSTSLEHAKQFTAAAEQSINQDNSTKVSYDSGDTASTRSGYDARSGSSAAIQHQVDSEIAEADRLSQNLSLSVREMQSAQVVETYSLESSQSLQAGGIGGAPGALSVLPTGALSEAERGMPLPSAPSTSDLIKQGDAVSRDARALPGEFHTAWHNFGTGINDAHKSADSHYRSLNTGMPTEEQIKVKTSALIASTAAGQNAVGGSVSKGGAEIPRSLSGAALGNLERFMDRSGEPVLETSVSR